MYLSGLLKWFHQVRYWFLRLFSNLKILKRPQKILKEFVTNNGIGPEEKE